MTRYAPTHEQAERIIANRFYRNISGTLSGTQEYMAMEKLYELYAEGGYDLIVIDTPPTRNALDFLDAPKRMTDFFESRVLRWFLLPYMKAGGGIIRVANVAAATFLEDREDASWGPRSSKTPPSSSGTSKACTTASSSGPER